MNGTENTTAGNPDDPFPSFDSCVTHILSNVLHIESESSDPTCSALIEGYCRTWDEFLCLSDAFVASLDYRDSEHRFVPLSTHHAFRLYALSDYMDYLDAKHGPATSFDSANYNRHEFLHMCFSNYDLDAFHGLCHPRHAHSVPSIGMLRPLAASTTSRTRAFAAPVDASPTCAPAAAPSSPCVPVLSPTCITAAAIAPSPTHTVPSTDMLPQPSAATPASRTRVLAAYTPPPRVLAAPATASPPCAPAAATLPPLCVSVPSLTCALTAPATASHTCDTAATPSPPYVPAVSPTTWAPSAPPHTPHARRTPMALTHVPVHLPCPTALSFLSGAFSAVASFGPLTRRHRDAITTQLYNLYTPVLLPSPLHDLLLSSFLELPLQQLPPSTNVPTRPLHTSWWILLSRAVLSRVSPSSTNPHRDTARRKARSPSDSKNASNSNNCSTVPGTACSRLLCPSRTRAVQTDRQVAARCMDLSVESCPITDMRCISSEQTCAASPQKSRMSRTTPALCLQASPEQGVHSMDTSMCFGSRITVLPYSIYGSTVPVFHPLPDATSRQCHEAY
eukprot:CAMPEP_0172394936 /NCGR_PEP_ID=MMETSP1061-20121228/17112_1 /TAXON_ID=37318 /ORGANISM="Pseudo-nitzschia pungens, Strain cf. pungens" /LENGTH=562 /DNA_ID=CAMNT_0013126395 /DNA_START=120 /DNA_END=1808 /DNA_ORIENTATION=+